ncbi:relaxase/mobilization nuclease domain-containing protein [Salinibacter ruber]|uniref:relaxase/mobilization nuclease domain-containing protein n=1 Tax=Salinibacter ruber TaxID=146919 RepID=UPI002169056C|nr:hypothetical protein [Salinibacter ruber]MCS4198328.1 hypothetical protein [Salinibacter ruber]
MISLGRTGSDFSGLASYLVGGGVEKKDLAITKGKEIRRGQPRSEVARQYAERVGHVKTRNVVSEAGDIESIVKEMEAGAAASEKVEKPVYHISISWPDEDYTTQQERIAATERVLEEIGLGGHQALIVEHREGKAHMHAMVNRVQHSPFEEDYGTAWETWEAWKKTEASLRRIEKEEGWRQVPGQNAPTPGLEKEPGGEALTFGQMQYYRRTGDPPLEEQVRTDLEFCLKRAEQGEIGWKQLDRELRKRDYRIERRGSGGVVRDEESGQAVALSSVGREYSMPRLEQSIGREYSEYLEQPDPHDERLEGLDDEPAGDEPAGRQGGQSGREQPKREQPEQGQPGPAQQAEKASRQREEKSSRGEGTEKRAGGGQQRDAGPEKRDTDASAENGSFKARPDGVEQATEGSDGWSEDARSDAGESRDRAVDEAGRRGGDERSSGESDSGSSGSRDGLGELADGADPLTFGIDEDRERAEQQIEEARRSAEEWVDEHLPERLEHPEEELPQEVEPLSQKAKQTSREDENSRKGESTEKIPMDVIEEKEEQATERFREAKRREERLKKRIEEIEKVNRQAGFTQSRMPIDRAHHVRKEIDDRLSDLRDRREKMHSERRSSHDIYMEYSNEKIERRRQRRKDQGNGQSSGQSQAGRQPRAGRQSQAEEQTEEKRTWATEADKRWARGEDPQEAQEQGQAQEQVQAQEQTQDEKQTERQRIENQYASRLREAVSMLGSDGPSSRERDIERAGAYLKAKRIQTEALRDSNVSEAAVKRRVEGARRLDDEEFGEAGLKVLKAGRALSEAALPDAPDVRHMSSRELERKVAKEALRSLSEEEIDLVRKELEEQGQRWFSEENEFEKVERALREERTEEERTEEKYSQQSAGREQGMSSRGEDSAEADSAEVESVPEKSTGETANQGEGANQEESSQEKLGRMKDRDLRQYLQDEHNLQDEHKVEQQEKLLRRVLREDAEDKEDLLSGLRLSREDTKEVHDLLAEHERGNLKHRISEEWEKRGPSNLRLRGEEGKIRPALNRGRSGKAAEAFWRLDPDRADEVWKRLWKKERKQVWRGAMKVTRCEGGTQADYKELSEEQQAIVRRVQNGDMNGNNVTGPTAEDLKKLAADAEGLSKTVSEISQALPTQAAKETLQKASEKAKKAIRREQERSQSRGRGGRR